MRYFQFILYSALDDFKKNKVRTFLTTLGIVIGISSVILLNSLGLGLKKYIQEQFESLGANTMYILPGKFTTGASFSEGANLASAKKFNEEDLNQLKKIREIEFLSPMVSFSYKATGTKKTEIADAAGGNADIFPLLNLKIDKGVIFKETDVEKKSKVAVLGYKIAEKTFGSKYLALNKTIKLNDQRFKVIGILQNIAGVSQIDDHNMLIFAPYKSLDEYTANKEFIAFYLKAKDSSLNSTVKEKIVKSFKGKYKDDEYSVLEQKELLNSVVSIFNILNMVLVGIGAISLIVGGVGIMNIMYISVAEKINEIGVRRAIGATKYDILWQFLAEAVILSLFGGIIGLLLVYLLILAINRVFPAYIDIQTVMITITISSLIGVVFGMLPAKKASDLTPVEAMRQD